MIGIILTTCFIMLTIATIYDLKGRYVPDYVSYTFISIAITERVIYAIQNNNPTIIWWSLIGGSILTGFGYVLYRGGMWGGGDVKIIASTGILIAWFPSENIPLFIDFFMNLIIVSPLYVMPAAIITGLKNKVYPTNKERIIIISIGIIIGLITYSTNPKLINALLSMGIIMTASITYLKRIEQKGFIKKADMKKLMDGDWLVQEIKVGREIIKPKKQGLTKKEAAKIKKWWKEGKLKKRPLIKEGIPYLPAFLLGFTATILFNNLMILIIAEGMIKEIELIKLLQ